MKYGLKYVKVIFDAYENKNGTIFVHFSQFYHLWSGLF